METNTYTLPKGAPLPTCWSLTFELYTLSGPNAGQVTFEDLRFKNPEEAAETLADFEACDTFTCYVSKTLRRRDRLELAPVYA